MKKKFSLVLALLMTISLVTLPAEASNVTDDLASVAEKAEGKTASALGLPTENWCCYFVRYCFNNSSAKNLAGTMPSAYGANPETLINWVCSVKHIGTYHSFSSKHTERLNNKFPGISIVEESAASFVPERGDIIIFNWSGQSTNGFSHAGILTWYDKNTHEAIWINGNGDVNSGTVTSKKKYTNSVNYYQDWIIGYLRLGTAEDIDEPDSSIEDGTYTLTPRCAPNSCLDVKGGSTASGANVQIYQSNGSKAQQFQIKWESGDYYTITAVVSGKRLDVANARTTSGTNVQQCNANTNAAQRWKIVDLGNGYYRIVSKLSDNLCLDVNGKGSANGTNVQVWSKNSSTAQQWKLTKVEEAPKQYKVYFDAQGGTVSPSSMTYTSGASLNSLPTPTRAGYTFKGWKMGNTGSVGVVVNKDNIGMFSEDITLYAMWEKTEKTYTVTLDDGSVCQLITVTNGKTYGSLPTPTKSGYTFDGWYTSKSGGSKVTSSTTVNLSGNTTLYAHWSAVPQANTPQPSTTHTHTKGSFKYSGDSHPHYNYYTCSTCGEVFTDGTTTQVVGCDQCGHWSSWSSWSDTAVTKSSTRQVETRQVEVTPAHTEYRYGRYIDPVSGTARWCATWLNTRPGVSGKVEIQYSNWSTTRYSGGQGYWTCGYCKGDHSTAHHFTSDGRAWWIEYILPNNQEYYWEQTRTVAATYKTQYRYRDWIAN